MPRNNTEKFIYCYSNREWLIKNDGDTINYIFKLAEKMNKIGWVKMWRVEED